MKDKYQKIFTDYVKNTNIAKGDKDFILDIDFINNNPDFYLFYPLLFLEYYETKKDKVNLLCVAGYFYYQSIIFLDN
ncbi:hypothetical protein [uncultured Formosa sp.]|uniref:hypothetical protein n=1 Tax=uncultured Formosa sp. TaxID=255435 RepID=UPI002625D5E0|nr:hypothetical protein [uncultured Formosa sp.]